MKRLTLKELSVPLIKAIDSFNYLLKSHHRRTAIISYYIGKKLNLSNGELLNLVIAAALHDVGALSTQERDMLIKQDVEFPEPHCIMGYRMLSSFEHFITIAQIIKHHHIKYCDLDKYDKGEVLFQSEIIHLADRVDVLTSSDIFILNQKKAITNEILSLSGKVFNPLVCDAFHDVSKADVFWININNMTMDKLLLSLDFTLDYDLDIEGVIEFAKTISKIIDFRSKYTASHSCTVANLAFTISSLLGQEEDMCKKLMVAGYLHDLGKLGIDPAVIEKEGPLTDEEYNQIKLHPYYTEQILADLSSNDWFEDIIMWSKNHHENLLGTGYPFAISNNDINLGIKILAYSDVISALMEDRPYRVSLSFDKMIEILRTELIPKLGEDVFNIISQNKNSILQVVNTCRQGSLELYKRQM